MTGGLLAIDGNTGFDVTSPANGNYLFEAVTAMQSFSFTGGIIQIADPPFDAIARSSVAHTILAATVHLYLALIPLQLLAKIQTVLAEPTFSIKLES